MTTKQKAEMYDIIMIGLKGLHKSLTSLADASVCEPKDPENMKSFECFQYGTELAYREAAREVEKFLEVD